MSIARDLEAMLLATRSDLIALKHRARRQYGKHFSDWPPYLHARHDDLVERCRELQAEMGYVPTTDKERGSGERAA